VKYLAIFIGCVVAGSSIAAAIELAVFLFASRPAPAIKPNTLFKSVHTATIVITNEPTTTTELLFDTSRPTTNLILAVHNDGNQVFAITHDGNVQFGPGVEPTEAARVFAAEVKRLLTGVRGGLTNAEAAQ
jgi:hypothetical protein